MIDPGSVPEVDADETLARYVLYGSHLRSDGTVKPDALIPHPYHDLSVTRHLSATTDELWSVGKSVAAARNKKLHGRADVPAKACLNKGLVVVADPVNGNPNHANIKGWPGDKPAQKQLAQQLAAEAAFRPYFNES